jgi:hypothetical protein
LRMQPSLRQGWRACIAIGVRSSSRWHGFVHPIDLG